MKKQRSLYKKALEIRESALGTNHPDNILNYDNLALLYYAQGKYEEAEPLYKKALKMCKDVLEANHPDTSPKLQ